MTGHRSILVGCAINSETWGKTEPKNQQSLNFNVRMKFPASFYPSYAVKFTNAAGKRALSTNESNPPRSVPVVLG